MPGDQSLRLKNISKHGLSTRTTATLAHIRICWPPQSVRLEVSMRTTSFSVEWILWVRDSSRIVATSASLGRVHPSRIHFGCLHSVLPLCCDLTRTSRALQVTDTNTLADHTAHPTVPLLHGPSHAYVRYLMILETLNSASTTEDVSLGLHWPVPLPRQNCRGFSLGPCVFVVLGSPIGDCHFFDRFSLSILSLGAGIYVRLQWWRESNTRILVCRLCCFALSWDVQNFLCSQNIFFVAADTALPEPAQRSQFSVMEWVMAWMNEYL